MTPSERAAFEARARAMREECEAIVVRLIDDHDQIETDGYQRPCAKPDKFCECFGISTLREIVLNVRALPLPEPESIASTPEALTCAICGAPATCFGAYEDAEEPAYACDSCCGHGNEDGYCHPLRAPHAQTEEKPLTLAPLSEKPGMGYVVNRSVGAFELRPERQEQTKHEKKSARSTYCRCGYPWIGDRCASPDVERPESQEKPKEEA